MQKKRKLTIVSGMIASALALIAAQSSQAQVSLGCRRFKAVNVLAVGATTQDQCADNSAASSAKLESTTAGVKTFTIRANLKDQAAQSARVTIVNSSGVDQCPNSNAVDQNGSLASIDSKGCGISTANAINMRLTAGDATGS